MKGARLIGGVVCDARGIPINDGWRRNPFYVHPLDGTLREAPQLRRPHHKPKEMDYVRGKDDMHQYRLIQGLWYEVESAPYPTALDRRVLDVLLGGKLAGGSPSRVDAGRFYGRYVYAKTKRQVGKDQIRKLKLWEGSLGRKARQAAPRERRWMIHLQPRGNE